MTEPRTTDTIYESLKDSLTGKIAKLSNFTERSFNYVWTRAFADEVRELEKLGLVSKMVGFIDYSGGPVTEDSLEDLGVADSIDADEVNELMDDEYLDEFVKIVGVRRLPGSKAAGNVTIETRSAETNIPEGTVVTTEADADGNIYRFVTTEDVSTDDNEESISGVSIEAEEVGPDHNVPAGTIIRFADPPVGVKSVTNPESTTGGEDEETNDELRERAKSAVEGAAEGGTVEGIKSFIRNNVEGVRSGDVILDEFKDQAPPYVDVIVDGGIDEDVTNAIEDSRPTGIRHNLVRPEVIQVCVDADLVGMDIDTAEVEEEIETFLLNLGISEDFYKDILIKRIMNADDDIINIGFLSPSIGRVTNERFTYDDTKTDYRLDFTYVSEYGSVTIEDENGTTYTEGTDFNVVDQTGDGWPETIVWDTGQSTPTDGDSFHVDYDVTTIEQDAIDRYKTDLVRDEVHVFGENVNDEQTYSVGVSEYELDNVPFDGTDSVTDNSGDTYTTGTDYQIYDYTGNGFPQTLDWRNLLLDGAVADDGGTTTDETDEASNYGEDDMTLLPESPSVDDAYYFGSSTTFGRIELNVSTGGDGTWDFGWEYYNGTSWVSLSDVVDDTNAFRNRGANDVSWTVPGDWSTTDVGGLTGLYWVRARVTSFTDILQQPLGQRAFRNSSGSTPDNDEDFTVTYDQKVYGLEYEVVETPKGEIKDESGNVYEQDVDYDFADYDANGNNQREVLYWFDNPTSISGGDEFYVTYNTEGDLNVGNREKVDPKRIDVSVE